jgi:ABC-type oligopeptide transport system ATPase subunit
MSEHIIKAEDLTKIYSVNMRFQSLFSEIKLLKAVDGVSFTIKKNETLSLVGESGQARPLSVSYYF